MCKLKLKRVCLRAQKCPTGHVWWCSETNTGLSPILLPSIKIRSASLIELILNSRFDSAESEIYTKKHILVRRNTHVSTVVKNSPGGTFNLVTLFNGILYYFDTRTLVNILPKRLIFGPKSKHFGPKAQILEFV